MLVALMSFIKSSSQLLSLLSKENEGAGGGAYKS
jgi:hypothetical protein